MKRNVSFPTQRKVTLIGKNAQVEAMLVDISLNDAGVITPRGAAKGTELELKFEVPADGEFKELSIPGMVTHRHNVDDHIYLKLEYIELNSQSQQVLQAFLDYKMRLRKFGEKPDFFR